MPDTFRLIREEHHPLARVLVFAFDLTEASQIRRIRSLQMLGHLVETAAFRRSNMNADFAPDWPNTDLGFVKNERYGRRVFGILRGIWRMRRQRQTIKAADAIVARNFDLLVIAWASRVLAGATKVPLVYECLDIHGLFSRPGVVGRFMRWCERRLLSRIQLLIVSSPGFITHYFSPIQRYRGAYQVIENKLWFDGPPVARPAKRANQEIMTLGWVGSIRCGPSLKILMQTADLLGNHIAVHIHGNVHRHALPDFDAEVAKRKNVTYFGPYAYPAGLADAYGSCDLVWAQDLWQRGNNSDWLLPNRIYEASWFGCPSVAVADTETGRKIAADRLGFTIDEPDAKALVSLLRTLDHARVGATSRAILEMKDTAFMLRPSDVRAALEPVLG